MDCVCTPPFCKWATCMCAYQNISPQTARNQYFICLASFIYAGCCVSLLDARTIIITTDKCFTQVQCLRILYLFLTQRSECLSLLFVVHCDIVHVKWRYLSYVSLSKSSRILTRITLHTHAPSTRSHGRPHTNCKKLQQQSLVSYDKHGYTA